MFKENFDDLFRKHYPEIYRLCFRMVRNKEDAEELTNDTFVKAYLNMHKFNPQKSSFRVWLFKIAYDQCIDFLRKKKRRKKLPTISIEEPCSKGEEAETYGETLVSDQPSPDMEFLRKEIWTLFEDCLEEPTEEERTAFVLYHLEGFTYEEIARILRKSLTTARNRIKSAIEKLKSCLELKGVDESYFNSQA